MTPTAQDRSRLFHAMLVARELTDALRTAYALARWAPESAGYHEAIVEASRLFAELTARYSETAQDGQVIAFPRASR
jgi:hypothetical protein